MCPVFCGDGLYLCATARSPKVRDLREAGSYALHAFLGDDDEEFQVAGDAREVDSASERGAVHEAIPFPAFDRDDPLFRLSIGRALWVCWERAGEADTRAIRRSWTASRG